MLKTKIAYLMLIIVMIAFFVMYVSSLSFIALLLIAFLPLVLWVLGMISKYTTKIDVFLPQTVITKRGKTTLKVKVENKSFLPLSAVKICLKYHNEFFGYNGSKTVMISAGPFTTQTIECDISSKHCGDLVITYEKAIFYDYFRLWKFRKPSGEELTATFIPDLGEISAQFKVNHNFISESDVFSKHKQGDDPSEVFKIRDYMQGDKLNRIHWKLSSKYDNMLVKEYSLPINHSVIILLELLSDPNNQNDADYIDAAIETAFLMSKFLLSRDINHYFAWIDGETDYFHKIAIDTEDDIFSALNILISSQPYQGTAKGMMTYQSAEKNNIYSNICYITSYLTDEIEVLFGTPDTMYRTILKMSDDTFDMRALAENSKVVTVKTDEIRESLNKLEL